MGVVLTGGRSSRFGRDKASEPLLGRPLLQHVLLGLRAVLDDCLVVKAPGQVLPPLETPLPAVVEDAFPGAGPLGGIYTGLLASGADLALVVACDMPLLQPELLAELLRLAPGQDAVVPLNQGGPEPLCAVYASACLQPFRRRLEAGEYKLVEALAHVRTLYLEPERWRASDPEGLSFINVNRQPDLARAERLMAQRPGRAAPGAAI